MANPGDVGFGKTGALGVRRGGTGLRSLPKGSVLFAIEPNVFRALDVGAADEVLTVAGGLPSWAAAGGGTPDAHNLIDTTGHPVTGLVTGNFIRATGATTYAFAAIALGDLPAIDFSDLTGTAADGQIPESAVTQHQAALSIAFGQITGTVDADTLDGIDSLGFALVSHVHPTSEITSGTFLDARIAESNVTQHEAALSIGAAQVTAGTFGTGSYVFPADLVVASGNVLRADLSRFGSHFLTVSTAAIANSLFLDNLDDTAAASGSRVLFRFRDTSQNFVTAASIQVTKEQVWTSTASTQDAEIGWSLATNGVLTERMVLNSDGELIVGSDPGDGGEVLRVESSARIGDVFVGGGGQAKIELDGTNASGFTGVGMGEVGGGLQLWARNSVIVRIDSDSNATDQKFILEKDAGTEIFSVGESGLVTSTGGRVIDRTHLTSDTTLTGAHHYITVPIPVGTRTLTLPASPVDGQEYYIRCTTSVAGQVDIARNGNLINNAAANITIIVAGEGRHMVYDTTAGSWWATVI